MLCFRKYTRASERPPFSAVPMQLVSLHNRGLAAQTPHARLTNTDNGQKIDYTCFCTDINILYCKKIITYMRIRRIVQINFNKSTNFEINYMGRLVRNLKLYICSLSIVLITISYMVSIIIMTNCKLCAFVYLYVFTCLL